MILFLLTFVLLYGGFHAYIYFKIRAAFHPDGLWTGLILALFALMVLMPILVHLAERTGWVKVGHGLAYAGYGWFGVVFLFVSAAAVLDLYHVGLRLLSFLLRHDWSAWRLAPRYGFLLTLFLALAINVYGFFSAWNIRSEPITLRTDKLPASVGRIRIAQLSDVHLGIMVGERRLEAMLAPVRAANPDLVVVTGDLVDGQPDRILRTLPLLREIRPRFGKFAVTGNHEFYAGLDHSLAFMEDAGFRVLRGEGVDIAGVLNLAGVDDRVDGRFSEPRFTDEGSLLRTLPGDRFTILLKHRPEVAPESRDLFDLQLSGHTHRGQIFPFSLLTERYFPYHAGLYTLGPVSRLYVSRGTGFWGPPIRFLAPPEVTILDIVAAKSP